MSYTAFQTLKANSVENLTALMDAAIADDWSPVGEFPLYVKTDGHTPWQVVMAQGTAPSSVDQVVADVGTLQAASASTVYSADGAIAVAPHIAIMAKASAAAMTLGVPTSEQDGARIPFVKATDFEHTITAAANTIVDAYTGNVGNRLTLSSSPGLVAELVAYDGKWYCSTANGGSVSDV